MLAAASHGGGRWGWLWKRLGCRGQLNTCIDVYRLLLSLHSWPRYDQFDDEICWLVCLLYHGSSYQPAFFSPYLYAFQIVSIVLSWDSTRYAPALPLTSSGGTTIFKGISLRILVCLQKFVYSPFLKYIHIWYIGGICTTQITGFGVVFIVPIRVCVLVDLVWFEFPIDFYNVAWQSVENVVCSFQIIHYSDVDSVSPLSLTGYLYS